MRQKNDIKGKASKRGGRRKVLETAVFLDSLAYRKFSRYFKSIGKFVRIGPSLVS